MEREILSIKRKALRINLDESIYGTFAEIGAGVKHRSPFATTFFSGYTNGVNLYLPTAPAYLEGGYEVWMAPFSPEVAGMVVEESVRLLEDICR